MSDSQVSSCVKWFTFAFNFFFWVVSIGFIAVGIWAYVLTKEFNVSTSQSQQPKDLFDYLFDFSLIFIVFGVVVFIFSLIGLLGSLRENICLLRTFAIGVGVLFLVELAIAITVLALSSQAKESVEDILRDEAIRDYRETNINARNAIDWFQETFECCGVGPEGFRAWEGNRYFSCNSPSFERCSVPYSCCQKEFRYKYDSMTIYTRCGHGALNATSKAEASSTIFVTGCVDAVIEYAKDNIVIAGVVVLVIVLPQLTGIFLAWILARQVAAQKKNWRYH